MNETKSDFDNSLLMPYMTGVTLAVNAISDAYMVVDAPNCVFFKTAQIQGNHDWLSTLVSSDGRHRMADTDCTTERAAQGDQQILVSRLREVHAIEDCAVMLLTAMSPAAVTGRQYDKILREIDDGLDKPVVQVRPGSLKGDWMAGYTWTMEDLAKGIDLPEPEPDGERVAIVGYLLDRNEADHTANLAALEHMLRGISLELTSVWFAGTGYEDLRAISKAGTILSLPYGREAARTLADRTGARVLDCGLPMGLEGTAGWLRGIADAFDRQKEADRFIDEELARVTPRLEWILPHDLLNKGVAILGSDPHLLDALAATLTELGCKLVLRVDVTHKDNLAGMERTYDGCRVLHNPDADDFLKPLHALRAQGDLDLIITNSRLIEVLRWSPQAHPIMELGFPSYYTHALYDRPFLGFDGVLMLVESMANTMGRAAVLARSREEG